MRKHKCETTKSKWIETVTLESCLLCIDLTQALDLHAHLDMKVYIYMFLNVFSRWPVFLCDV